MPQSINNENYLTPEEMLELNKKLDSLSDEEVKFQLDNWIDKIRLNADADDDEPFKIIPPDLSDREALGYLYYIRAVQIKASSEIKHVHIKILPDGNCDLDYKMKEPPFQRIRRITGYLVGTLDRFNKAKRQEEKDRVKHTGKDGSGFNR